MRRVTRIRTGDAGGGGMTDLERLLAIEEIRRLKARRVRCMDEKDWPGYAACHTKDAISYTFGDNDTFKDSDSGVIEGPVRGGEAIAAALAGYLDGKNKRTTVHHIHAPEIELTSDTTAKGIWPMEDMLWWEEDGQPHWMHGYGHYHETYEKVGGEWLIASRSLTRIRIDTGLGPGPGTPRG
jgi:hypothetical protein